ncbi:MAG: vanadium-dependent haloperoxidase [Cyclobacteriaceae bacterium]
MKRTANILCLFLLFRCAGPAEELMPNDQIIPDWNDKLSDIIIHDIYNPPVASRIYAYSNLAAYEAIANLENNKSTFSGVINGLNHSVSVGNSEINIEIATLVAFSEVAESLIISKDSIRAWREADLAGYASSVQKKVLDESVAYGQRVAEAIIKYAGEDNYKKLTNMPGYIVSEDEDAWQPTPPAYLEAAEPNWEKLRPFALDSASQFIPKPPVPFDSKEGSDFYNAALVVYDAVNKRTQSDSIIAVYWDCNPQTTRFVGHAMMFSQKLTPGGHWISITSAAARSAKLDLASSAEIHAMVAMGIADAFINCWNEKYRSNLIRPETYINRYIDPDWRPILETPSFPEHTSGHSVASASAATILTAYFGENFSFTDSAEVRFGLTPRSYNSFREASDEAAVSRLYGGIHYDLAITEGIVQGNQVGQNLLQKIGFKN